MPPNFCTRQWSPRGQPSPVPPGSAGTMMGGASPPEAAALVDAAAGGQAEPLPAWASPLLREVAAGLQRHGKWSQEE